MPHYIAIYIVKTLESNCATRDEKLIVFLQFSMLS